MIAIKRIEANSQSRQQSSPPVVLLNGWGFGDGIWQPLLPVLSPWSEVYSVTLDDFGPDNVDSDNCGQDLDRLCTTILDHLPPRYVLLGWSLGGMLAARIAAQAPERITALITLATNGSFIVRDTWPEALSPKTFQQFYQKVTVSPEKGLKRFSQLVAHGSECSQTSLSWLQSQLSQAKLNNLLPGLDLLASIDNSQVYQQLYCPALHLLGERDVLVPSAAEKKIGEQLSAQQSVRVLAGKSHILHYPPTDMGELVHSLLSEASG